LIGPHLHSVEVSQLDKCASEIKSDQVKFGISCVKSLLEFNKVVVEHETDIARLKKEATQEKLLQGKPGREHSDAVLITNATILTMESGKLEHDIIRDAMLFVRGGVIQYVGRPHIDLIRPPFGVTVIDARGGLLSLRFKVLSFEADQWWTYRVYYSGIYRRSCPLAWVYGQVSRQVMGIGNLPCVWSYHSPQVNRPNIVSLSISMRLTVYLQPKL
jgi:hypothetical protein